MRSYRKQNAPDVLRDWNRSNRARENFVADPIVYSQVKHSLLEEQSHLCCYCESAIKDSDSHIEHYEPQSRAQNRINEYANLACSCNGSVDRNRHCGHRKGSTYENRLFINPSVDNSGELFSYDTNGGIDATKGISAENVNRVNYMIQTLNLDCARLTGMRRVHAIEIIKIIDGFINADARDQLEEMALYYLIPNEAGHLQRFFSLSAQLFENCSINILDEE